MGFSFIEEYFFRYHNKFYAIGRHIVIDKWRNKVIELSVHLNVHLDLFRVSFLLYYLKYESQFRVVMHLGVPECHVTYLGHFDFYFDL